MCAPTAPACYNRRAPEYDDGDLGVGMHRERERAGFDEEHELVATTLSALAPAGTLDVACGTGFLTRHLPGEVAGRDSLAVRRLPASTFVRGDALALPFTADRFERVVGGHFESHLDVRRRVAFLDEARAVAHELVLVDASRGHSVVDEECSQRRLCDGARSEVYGRWFQPLALVEIVVRSPR